MADSLLALAAETDDSQDTMMLASLERHRADGKRGREACWGGGAVPEDDVSSVEQDARARRVALQVELSSVAGAVARRGYPIECSLAVIGGGPADWEVEDALMQRVVWQEHADLIYIGVTTDPVRRWEGGWSERGWMDGHGGRWHGMTLLGIRAPFCATQIEAWLIESAR